MTKHILLLFLSDVKTSFNDGIVNISKTKYTNIGGDGQTETTNESAVRYLWEKEHIQLDRLFVFASNLVRQDITDRDGHHYKDSFGNTCTHLAYFRKRLVHDGVVSSINDCLNEQTIYPYDEDASVDETLLMVTEMADKIQEYVNKEGTDNVVLHVDLTGGKRSVNMMMLGLMRLMEYNHVHIGKVLYSDYDTKKKQGTVIEVNHIYKLFDLISGAEEFVSFGNVSVIDKYYRNYKDEDKSAALQKLLDAMKEFAAEIKLCHRGHFDQAVSNLQIAISEFNASAPQLLGDKLMTQMMQRIQKDYGELLQSDRNSLSSIRWCVEHDYLQQAITLYIETVPKYLFDIKAIELTNQGNKEIAKLMKDDNREQEFYALNVYEQENPKDKMQKEMKQKMDELITNVSQQLCSENEVKEELYTTFCKMNDIAEQQEITKKINQWQEDYYSMVKEILKKIQNHSYDLEQSKNACQRFINQVPFLRVTDEKLLYTALEQIIQLSEKPGKTIDSKNDWINKAIVEYVQHANNDNKAKWGHQKNYEKGKKLIGYLISNAPNDIIEKLFGSVAFGYSRKACGLLDAQKLRIHIPRKTFEDIMDLYGILKEERNLSNHANCTNSKFTTEGLKEYILSGLKELTALSKQ
jgi:hypothetical protein